MEKRSKATPKSAISFRKYPPATPSALSTNPATKKPTKGGSPTARLSAPNKNATAIQRGSL